MMPTKGGAPDAVAFRSRNSCSAPALQARAAEIAALAKGFGWLIWGVEAALQSTPARILLVEDEPLIRFLMAEALRERGVATVEAASADEAWQYLTAGGAVDLVFTDHRMPGSMSGAHLAVRIRRQYPTVVVIITSGYFNDTEWSEPVLPKPYNVIKTAADLARKALSRGQNRNES